MGQRNLFNCGNSHLWSKWKKGTKNFGHTKNVRSMTHTTAAASKQHSQRKIGNHTRGEKQLSAILYVLVQSDFILSDKCNKFLLLHVFTMNSVSILGICVCGMHRTCATTHQDEKFQRNSLCGAELNLIVHSTAHTK